jgi:hypothetical protein
MQRPLAIRTAIGSAVMLILCAAGYWAFVTTVWGQEFDNAAFFGRDVQSRAVQAMDTAVLGRVTNGFVAAGAAVLLVVALVRRRWLSGFAAVAGVALAVGGAEVLKETLPRGELVVPEGIEPGYFKADTYPSGHTSVGTSLALAAVLVAGARWRIGVAVGAAVVSVVYGTGVFFMGWHRPSDAVGGILWSGFCLGLVVCVVAALKGNPRAFVFRGAAAPVLVVLCAGMVAAMVWVAAGFLDESGPDFDFPYFAMTTLIVAAAFGVAGWLGFALDGIEEI